MVNIKHKDLLIEVVKERIESGEKYIEVVSGLKHIGGTDVPQTRVIVGKLKEVLEELQAE